MSYQDRVSVCAIVLSYDAREDLALTLRSLQESSFPVDILVIDNHSQDDPSDFLAQHFPNVSVQRLLENRGFAGGMNVGIHWALDRGYDFFWLINQDAQVETSTLTQLIEVALQNKRYGLLSPCIMHENGKLWFCGGRISYARMRTLHKKRIQRKAVIESEYLTGCALLLSRALVSKIGLLDEGYFLYYEDAEYSLRARKNRFLPIVVTASRVRHAERSTLRKEKVYWLVRSAIRFFLRESPWYWRPWVIGYLALRRTKNLLERRFRPSEIASLVGQAYTDASHEKQ